MLASYKWMCEIAGFSPDPDELAKKLTFSGLEVDSICHLGQNFDNIVVAEIIEYGSHPKKNNLHLVKVNCGDEIVPVVCGAHNCPQPGGRVILAKVGSTIGNSLIEPRKLAGEISHGMLCSEAELNIGPDDDGIIVLGDDINATAGTPIAEALQLEDRIYELGVTPNRPDALCHRGLAREMALLFDKPFKTTAIKNAPKNNLSIDNTVNIELISTQKCPRYAAALMTNVIVKESSFATRYRLFTLGIKPVSNLVDITNLILLEYSQPLHAFDLDKIADKKIIIRKAKSGEKMTTLDETKRTFSSDDLLICDPDGPVAIAGVMGGLNSSISKQTKNVLIESAYFNPSTIRKTSKRLKLSSESSYRFERGIDPNQTKEALAKASALIAQLSKETKYQGIIDCYPSPIIPLSVTFRPARYKHIMGYNLEPSLMRNILEGIGAIVKSNGEKGRDEKFTVSIPTNRPDIEREIDLIEEIARISGLDKVKTYLPKIQCTVPKRTEFETTKKIKYIMASLGLYESVSYSFVSSELLKSLHMNNDIVKIANPLNSERAAMRTTLLAGLLENLKRAESKYVSSFMQFEVGRTFHNVKDALLPTEILKVAAILHGPLETWISEKQRNWDFYDAKGLTSALIEEATGICPTFTSTNNIPYLHPNKACKVSVNNVEVGIMGEIHPKTLAANKLDKGSVCFEIEVMKLHDLQQRSIAVNLSDFPPMSRDTAFLVSDDQNAEKIGTTLKEACGHLAKEVKLFDIYSGEGIEDGKKSLAFSVQYQSFEKTLTDKEIDALHQNAVKKVMNKFKISTR